MKAIDRKLLLPGLLIPFWLFFGVVLTALAYPGYSHLDQAMSQLGAQGAPTFEVSAKVNNFPLGVFFVLFGLGVAKRFRESRVALISAGLIVVHGLGSFATGYFPCDQGCAPAQPSAAQQAHNLAGLLMFLSLTLASALWVFLGKRLLPRTRFGVFSALCVVVSVVSVSMMAKAVADGHLFGLYQRINYGVSVVWIAALAMLSMSSRDAVDHSTL